MVNFKFLSEEKPNRGLLPNEQFIAFQDDDGFYRGRVIAWKERLPYVDWDMFIYYGTIGGFFEDRLAIPQIKKIRIDGINYDAEMLDGTYHILRESIVEITYFEPL